MLQKKKKMKMKHENMFFGLPFTNSNFTSSTFYSKLFFQVLIWNFRFELFAWLKYVVDSLHLQLWFVFWIKLVSLKHLFLMVLLFLLKFEMNVWLMNHLKTTTTYLNYYFLILFLFCVNAVVRAKPDHFWSSRIQTIAYTAA
jgi:hypothetical protein